MLPYLFAALAVSPLTVIELIFGSRRYFLRIQIEQLLIIVIAFIALPYFGVSYEIALLAFVPDLRALLVHFAQNESAGENAFAAGAENMQLNTGRYLEAYALMTLVFCGTVQYFTGIAAVLWLPFFWCW